MRENCKFMKKIFQNSPSEALWKNMDEAEEVLDVVAMHVSRC